MRPIKGTGPWGKSSCPLYRTPRAAASVPGADGRQRPGHGNADHHVELRLEGPEHLERAEHRGGPRHVELHVLHVLRRLIEIPPESNVTPFPTRTMGGAASPAPRYSSTMKRGSCSVPCATASSAPMPSCRIAARSSVVRVKPYASASCFARSAR